MLEVDTLLLMLLGLSFKDSFYSNYSEQTLSVYHQVSVSQLFKFLPVTSADSVLQLLKVKQVVGPSGFLA